jgi:hypothetical protein
MNGAKYKMNDDLQDVITAAVDTAVRKTAGEVPSRRVAQLRAVDNDRNPDRIGDNGQGVPDTSFGGDSKLGRHGLRLAFWLCGFHAALLERQRKGEKLTDHEESLLTLSRKDFGAIRPMVVDLAMDRLAAVVNAPELTATAETPPAPLDLFALETMRRMSSRGRQLLDEDGPDAALGLFGDGPATQEPLAIFQMVFGNALGVVESFDSINQSTSPLLTRLSDALGSEVERI